MVIDKPAGLPVDTPRRGGDSVVARLTELQQRLPAAADPDAPARPGHVGMPVARSVAQGAVKFFQQAFETRQVEKYYLAVVDGVIEAGRGRDRSVARQEVERRGRLADGCRIPRATRRSPTGGSSRSVRDGPWSSFSRSPAAPINLRVHAREAFGRGIVGDRVYGVPGGAMLLHASRLVVPREKKAAIDVSAPAAGLFRGLAR